MNELRDWLRSQRELWKDAIPEWYFFYLTICGILFVIILMLVTV